MSSVSPLSSLLSGSSSSSSNSLNLSQLLQAVTGSASEGLDVPSLVEAGVYAAQAPERSWQDQETALQKQYSALTTINTAVGNLSKDLDSLNSMTGSLAALSVNSSQTSIVTGSAAAGAVPGSHVVTVTNLATTASWYSGSVASSSTGLSAASFSLQVGSGTATPITVTAGETLTQLASSINGMNLGVTASVVNDASGSRLAIVSNSSGSASDITITNDTTDTGALQFTQAAQGKNAALTVDGIPISSATNTVTGAVTGLTLNLVGAAPATQTTPATPVNVSVAPDTSQISSAINQFVTDYNTIINNISAQFKYDATSSTAGPLAGDSTLRGLQSDLLGSASYVSGSGSSSMMLSSMGITMNDDGTLTVDSAALTNQIQSNPSGVQTFFQGTALNGFANTLNTQLQNFTAPTTGAFTVSLSNMKTEYTDLQNQVSDFEANYIANLRTTLTAQYNTAAAALANLKTTTQQINATLGNNSGSNG